MILTEKCKEKFLEYIYYREDTNQANEDCKEAILYEADKWINRQDERLINTLIIEFFDSIKCSGFKSLWSYCFGVGDYDVFKDNWNEHIQQAITKANEIYNELL